MYFALTSRTLLHDLSPQQLASLVLKEQESPPLRSIEFQVQQAVWRMSFPALQANCGSDIAGFFHLRLNDSPRSPFQEWVAMARTGVIEFVVTFNSLRKYVRVMIAAHDVYSMTGLAQLLPIGKQTQRAGVVRAMTSSHALAFNTCIHE